MMLPGPLFLGGTISVGMEIALTVGRIIGCVVLYVSWVLVVSVRHQKWLNGKVAEEIGKESSEAYNSCT